MNGACMGVTRVKKGVGTGQRDRDDAVLLAWCAYLLPNHKNSHQQFCRGIGRTVSHMQSILR